jgi:hypothetical protein
MGGSAAIIRITREAFDEYLARVDRRATSERRRSPPKLPARTGREGRAPPANFCSDWRAAKESNLQPTD